MKKYKSTLIFLCQLTLCVVGIFVLGQRYKVALVEGTSMESTLNSGDVLIMDGRVGLQHNDIVAVKLPNSDEYVCKRIIGMSGDRIDIVSGVTYVNGEILDEPYVSSFDKYTDISCTVPDDYIFVLGDNRLVSADSRTFGCLPKDGVVGVMIANITNFTGITSKYLKVTWIAIVIIFLLIEVVLYARRRKKLQ